MKIFLFAVMALAAFPLVSCTAPQAEFSPNGPTSNKSDISWNRPVQGEGGGALGGALQ